MTRTDVHRPSAINPSDYRFVAFDHVKIEDLGSCEYAREQRERIQEDMQETGGSYSSHEHGGNCMVCGNANATYTVLFHHDATNTYVRMGQDCAEKCEMSCGDWNGFRKAIHDAIEAKAGKRKAEAVLAEAGLDAAWTLHESEIPHCTCEWSESDVNGNYKYDWGFIYPDNPCTCPREGREEHTVRDVVGKLVKYGSISEGQVKLVRINLDRIVHRGEYEAKRMAEKAAAASCPTGRVTISGVVLKEELRDSEFGTQHKMFFKADEGYTIWASVPGLGKYLEAPSIVRGTRLTMKITLSPARDDPKHSFGSRPVLTAAPVPAALEVA